MACDFGFHALHWPRSLCSRIGLVARETPSIFAMSVALMPLSRRLRAFEASAALTLRGRPPLRPLAAAAASPAQGKARKLIAALAANLVVNAGWSWLYFKHHKLGASARDRCRRSGGQQRDVARRVGEADTKAGLALVLYPLRCAFATAMSTHIWRLNR
jgi:TspO/MBR family